MPRARLVVDERIESEERREERLWGALRGSTLSGLVCTGGS